MSKCRYLYGSEDWLHLLIEYHLKEEHQDLDEIAVRYEDNKYKLVPLDVDVVCL